MSGNAIPITLRNSARCWYDGHNICVQVTSDGTTGPQWLERFKQQDFEIGDGTEELLLSPSFQPTTGITFTVAILFGRRIEVRRTTDDIRSYAEHRKLVAPSLETGCLLCESVCDNFLRKFKLSRISVMHEPVILDGLYPALLNIRRKRTGEAPVSQRPKPRNEVMAYLEHNTQNKLPHVWQRGCGFAFATL